VILPDVNVLVYAHRRDVVDHERYRAWLSEAILHDQPYAISELVLSSVVRILTNRRVFRVPSTTDEALSFAEYLLAQPNCTPVRPGARHWTIFTRLCRESGAQGPLVPDAYFAALAIEHGCEWITADRDFARFKGLRWRHPLG
jgi:toxin-antitoxin system PIN domain toxin